MDRSPTIRYVARSRLALHSQLTHLRAMRYDIHANGRNVTRAERIDTKFLPYQRRKHRYTDGSFRYPPWLERWLQSPGVQHVHHSYLPHHRDKNLGLVTSVWDRLVGTLYIGSPWRKPRGDSGPMSKRITRPLSRTSSVPSAMSMGSSLAEGR
jgi:hypothetical protein